MGIIEGSTGGTPCPSCGTVVPSGCSHSCAITPGYYQESGRPRMQSGKLSGVKGSEAAHPSYFCGRCGTELSSLTDESMRACELEQERDEALVQLSMREAECEWLRRVEQAALAVDLVLDDAVDLSPGATRALSQLREALRDDKPDKDDHGR